MYQPAPPPPPKRASCAHSVNVNVIDTSTHGCTHAHVHRVSPTHSGGRERGDDGQPLQQRLKRPRPLPLAAPTAFGACAATAGAYSPASARTEFQRRPIEAKITYHINDMYICNDPGRAAHPIRTESTPPPRTMEGFNDAPARPRGTIVIVVHNILRARRDHS